MSLIPLTLSLPLSRFLGFADLCRLYPGRLHSFSLSFGIYLAALLNKLSGFFLRAALNGILFRQTFLGVVFAHVLGTLRAHHSGQRRTKGIPGAGMRSTLTGCPSAGGCRRNKHCPMPIRISLADLAEPKRARRTRSVSACRT